MTINIALPKNWRTTLAGLGVYVALFVQTMHKFGMAHVTDALNSTEFWMAFLVAGGLILAGDAKNTSTASAPEQTSPIPKE